MNEENQEWDYIIVGTGMGGSTAGHALAKAGRRVLFLEKGEDPATNPDALKGDFLEAFLPKTKSGKADAYRNSGRSHTEIWDIAKNRPLQPLLGSGAGGSTALFGMVMERFWPEDFEPRRYHPNADPDCSLPDRWPVTYDEMKPFYRQAEALYRVSSRMADPLQKDADFNYRPGPEAQQKSLRLHRYLKTKGLHPYMTPLALDWFPECHFCQSFLCDKNCKNDAAKICLRPAQKDHGAVLLTGCEVIRLEADERRVTKVIARHQGQTVVFSGKNIILAMGALMTPLLLLRSVSSLWPDGLANRSGLVGKNLMRHYIDLLAIFSRSPFPGHFTLKELGVNDFYVVDGQKFGTMGAFGHLPPTYMLLDDIEKDLKESIFLPVFQRMRPVTGALMSYFLGMAGYFALIMEDLPYPDNCVSWREGGDGLQVTVQYNIRPSEWERINRFRAMCKKALSPNPTMLLAQADNLKFLAHVSGTCRFGDDPKTSVLNKFNRSHDLENLYILDSSFFPSSGGTNPALTIAANALRVADHLAGKN